MSPEIFSFSCLFFRIINVLPIKIRIYAIVMDTLIKDEPNDIFRIRLIQIGISIINEASIYNNLLNLPV